MEAGGKTYTGQGVEKNPASYPPPAIPAIGWFCSGNQRPCKYLPAYPGLGVDLECLLAMAGGAVLQTLGLTAPLLV